MGTAPYQQMRGNCFELFGFDILIEENMRPWLIEVNLSPSLSISSPLDRKIKADVMADLLSLVGFSSKPPPAAKREGHGTYSCTACECAVLEGGAQPRYGAARGTGWFDGDFSDPAFF